MASSSDLVLTVLDSEAMADHYYRNNRTDLKKNVRCFPKCSPCHMQTKFCGASFRVKLQLLSCRDISSLRFYGEFMLEDDDGLYSMKDVSERELQNDNSGNYYAGAITQQQGNEYVIEFNKDCDAWCYGWTSNKQRTFYYHVFQVTVCSVSSTGQLISLARTRSPRFNIFSSRRRKEADAVIAPTASAISAPSVKTKSSRVSSKRSSSASRPNASPVACVELSRPMERVITNCKQVLADAQRRLEMYKQVKAEKLQKRLPIVSYAGVSLRSHSPTNPSLKLLTAARSLGPMPVKLLYDPIKMLDCDFDSLFGEGGTSDTRSTCSV